MFRWKVCLVVSYSLFVWNFSGERYHAHLRRYKTTTRPDGNQDQFYCPCRRAACNVHCITGTHTAVPLTPFVDITLSGGQRRPPQSSTGPGKKEQETNACYHLALWDNHSVGQLGSLSPRFFSRTMWQEGTASLPGPGHPPPKKKHKNQETEVFCREVHGWGA